MTANRRVSFAPEATLHTWDVIEYLRDATTSSTSPNSTRRVSSISQMQSGESAHPAIEPLVVASDPVSDAKTMPSPLGPEKKKLNGRRSSGIPPMNFNNPDDVFSSSPAGSQSAADSESTDMDIADAEGTTIDLLADDHTRGSNISNGSGDSTGSSARLDEALRLATVQAGTQGVEYEENDDESMELADDEITASFKPWAYKSERHEEAEEQILITEADKAPQSPPSLFDLETGRRAREMSVLDDHEGLRSQLLVDVDDALIGEEMPASEEMTMEFTTVFGGIKGLSRDSKMETRGGTKRRLSSTAANIDISNGSPARKRMNLGPGSRRRSSAGRSSLGEELMDLTTAIGGIRGVPSEGDHDLEGSVDVSFGEEIMDLTTAIGGIRNVSVPGARVSIEFEQEDSINEDLSMDLTTVLGGIRNGAAQLSATASTTPTKIPAESQLQNGFKVPQEIPPTSSTPRSPQTAPKQKPATPQSSPRRSPRKSLVPSPIRRPTTPRARHASEEPKTPLAGERSPKRGSPKKAAEQTLPSPMQKTSQLQRPSLTYDAPPEVQSNSSPTREMFMRPSPKPTPLKSTAALSKNLKLLSTPQKQIQISPIKRPVTPKMGTTPKQEVIRMRSLSPRKSPGMTKIDRAARASSLQPGRPVPAQDVDEVKGASDRIHLRDFLNKTSIRFMDLSTTKRRHTIAPQAGSTSISAQDYEDSTGLADFVVAGACTVPMLELYQHVSPLIQDDYALLTNSVMP